MSFRNAAYGVALLALAAGSLPVYGQAPATARPQPGRWAARWRGRKTLLNKPVIELDEK